MCLQKLKQFFVRKKKKLFTGLGSVRIVKNCDLGLENFQDLGHSFSLYGPPSRQITYMSSLQPDRFMASGEFVSNSLTFGQLAADVIIVGISRNTKPKENVKSFRKDLRGKNV